MSWRTVVITGMAKLDYKMDYLVVRKLDATTRIHLSEIGILLVESTSISLTATLLSELVKKKIKVIFCDEKHNPHCELLPYYGCHDTSMKIKYQLAWTDKIKEAVWTEIVGEKIRQQMSLLFHKGYENQGELLHTYLLDLERGDATNREGHAAKVYFNSLFGLDFTRSSDRLENIALNYGYGILLSSFNKEIVCNGYLTQLGLFHTNRFNPFNLSSDLMEPFRILVDKKILSMTLEKFAHEEKMHILDFLNEEVFIGGKCQTVSNAIKIYCKSIFESLEERDLSLIKFYRDEL